jgi:putative oxidoreductase
MKSTHTKFYLTHLYLRQHKLFGHLENFKSLGLLITRFYLAKVFFLSGLTKITDWDSTLFLFNEEYQVPLLPPELAAWLGTGGELFLPVLLAFGLLGRFSAIGLCIVNIMAAISLSDIPPAALSQHILWGSLLAMIAISGVGKYSIDAWLFGRLNQSTKEH